MMEHEPDPLTESLRWSYCGKNLAQVAQKQGWKLVAYHFILRQREMKPNWQTNGYDNVNPLIILVDQ